MIELKALEPTEAAKFWADKKLVTRQEFDKLGARARERAFTVSGLSGLDELGQVHSAIAAALSGGEILADFKGRLSGLIEAKGWTDRRVDLIFRTNLQAAYMAGRYAQMKAVADSRPYWRYMAVLDNRTRPEHRALDGLVFRHDHPFWDTWFPPNGFNCRCTVQSLSERQLKERGYTVEEEIPEQIEPIDPKTGKPLPPVRIWPDRNFGTNPAADWLAALSPEEIDADQLVMGLARAMCRDGQGLFAVGPDPCAPPLAQLDRRHIKLFTPVDLLPAGLPPEAYVLAFMREFGIRDLGGAVVHNLVVTNPEVRPGDVPELANGVVPLVVSSRLFEDREKGGWKSDKRGRGPYMRLLAWTILDPFEAWLMPTTISGRTRDAINLIRPFAGEDGQMAGFAAFQFFGREWLGVTAFPPGLSDRMEMLDYLEMLRRGVLLHRERL